MPHFPSHTAATGGPVAVLPPPAKPALQNTLLLRQHHDPAAQNQLLLHRQIDLGWPDRSTFQKADRFCRPERPAAPAAQRSRRPNCINVNRTPRSFRASRAAARAAERFRQKTPFLAQKPEEIALPAGRDGFHPVPDQPSKRTSAERKVVSGSPLQAHRQITIIRRQHAPRRKQMGRGGTRPYRRCATLRPVTHLPRGKDGFHPVPDRSSKRTSATTRVISGSPRSKRVHARKLLPIE